MSTSAVADVGSRDVIASLAYVAVMYYKSQCLQPRAVWQQALASDVVSDDGTTNGYQDSAAKPTSAHETTKRRA